MKAVRARFASGNFVLLILSTACPGPPDSDRAPAASGWVAVAQGLEPALLDVAGTAVTDVWACGAAGTLLHHDGAWTQIPAGEGDLWWLAVDGAGAWVAGAGGRVLRVEGGEVEEEVLDESVTLYGIAAFGEELWAVGGNPDLVADGAVAFHRVDGAWSRAELPAEIATSYALYKVWGPAPDDVWAVGADGAAMHWDGQAWEARLSELGGPLFTVHGDGSEVWAVGGDVSGSILRWSDSGWVQETPAYATQITGLYAADPPVATGQGGSVWIRGEAGWVADAEEKETFQDLHATWVDPEGGLWAVGGHTSSTPLIQGVMIYRGSAEIAPLEDL